MLTKDTNIPRAFIGGKFTLSLVHFCQDCIFETDDKYQRAVYFHEFKNLPKRGIYPNGIYSEVQINDRGNVVSFVDWAKPNNKCDFIIKEFEGNSISVYESAIQWMTEQIETLINTHYSVTLYTVHYQRLPGIFAYMQYKDKQKANEFTVYCETQGYTDIHTEVA
jgi:hypothetical protein